jgi:adenine-specific DNA-methyltransferase
VFLNPKKALNKAFLRAPLQRELLDRFRQNFAAFAEKLDHSASEEFNKNILADFVKGTYYSPEFYVNVSEKIDLAIHVGPSSQTPIGVIIETKRGDNANEMCRTDRLNSKAMQELLLYYLRERVGRSNHSIRHLLITNFRDWFVFDAHEFDRAFYRNAQLLKQYRDFAEGRLAGTTTDFFYQQVAAPAIAAVESSLLFTYFTTSEIEKLLKKSDAQAERKLVPYLKLFSPEHLLKLPFQNDNNTLNKGFFDELLHIIGLQETRDGAKKLITRKKAGKRDPGSLVENAISQLQSLDRLSSVKGLSDYGDKEDDQLFNVALELSLSWINRVLFLKLLEAQLLKYARGDRKFSFLNFETVRTYGELNVLFFQVLAEPEGSRAQHAKKKFPHVPYLNSSLFEITELERQTLVVSNLLDDVALTAPPRTVFKDANGRRFSGSKPALRYLLEFLDAYDFSSEGAGEIHDSKVLINASVLGLIYEKINGYREGSFYTPGFITMGMTRAAITQMVVQRFAEKFKQPFKTIPEVYNAIKDMGEANSIVNSITICDPAVGSGHFLVSSLNEMLSIKSQLGILCDKNGKRLKDYVLLVENDELVVCDDEGNIFEYNPASAESQRVQETIFNEKRQLIESSLFGVDINKNSVNICRLRLWIELLKNSYYRPDGTLETLPNLDINIKCGNSLLSRLPLDSDLKSYLKKNKTTLKDYRSAVQKYRNAANKAEKRDMATLIAKIKGNFGIEILYNDPLSLKVETLKRQIKTLELPQSLFGETRQEKQQREERRKKLAADLVRLQARIVEVEKNQIFEHSFEWRIEFPEVLDDDGAFAGFDVVVGNPPYISAIGLQKIIGPREYAHLKKEYETARGTVDLFVYFFELAGRVVKDHASICYITPNRYLSANYGAELRKYLVERFTFQDVVDYSRVDVFEEAATYPVITHIKKGRSGDYSFHVYTQNEGGKSEVREFHSTQLTFTEDHNLGFLLSDKYDLAKKIVAASVPLTRAGQINATSTAAEADEFSKLITEGGKGFKLVNTGTIDRFVARWGTASLTDKKRVFKHPRLPRDSEELGQRRCDLYSSPKIVFAKIARRAEAFYDAKGEYASINTNCIHTFSEDFDPLYVLAWVNSRLFQYVYECFFDGLRMAGGFLAYSAPYLSNMFIKEISRNKQQDFGRLAEKIAAHCANDEDFSELERQLDFAFYALYGLTDEEIQRVERCFAEVESPEAAPEEISE